MHVRVKISCGSIVIVSDIDLKFFKNHKWKYDQVGAKSYVRATNGERPYLHRLIMQAPKGMVVDHINGNPLDNTRENLRVCSYENNNRNLTKKRGSSSSRFKGVSKHGDKWRARIQEKTIGIYDTEVEAALAYDAEAVKLFGKFAKTNSKDEL